MDGDLCLCDTCCSEDASEMSESSPPQSPVHDAEQREEELGEKYNQGSTSLNKTEEHGERLKQTPGQGHEFSKDKLRKIEKRKFADEESEVMGTILAEMGDRDGEELEFYMLPTSMIEGDENDLSVSESGEEEDEYQNAGLDDWQCSPEELEEAMCEDELLRSLYGYGEHMMECCM
ncbi:hypothetical protein EAE96_004919 [Botrytis aclada]|nr:hypothetical protein EAE96_004919 [Botrytis aclada]